jgi:hypothetical protein
MSGESQRSAKIFLNHQKAYPSDRFVTSQALSGITKITPFFHRIILSSQLNYGELANIFLGKIMQLNNSAHIAEKYTGKTYRSAGQLWLPLTNKKLQIFYNRTDPNYPASRLSIVNPSIENLIELDQTAERLVNRVSDKPLIQFASIEYTIDFHCDSSNSVGNLYYILRRNFYCPYAKRTVLQGGNFFGYSHDQDYSLHRKTNSVFHINCSDEGNRSNKIIKFYERGPDSSKISQDEFWHHVSCDRVRYEATIMTNILRDNNITTIISFLRNPKFSELIFPSNRSESLFQFAHFKVRDARKYSPPSCDQDYFHRDGNEVFFECFIDEVLYAKKQKLDTSNYIHNYDRLDELVARAKESVIDYETGWKKKAIRLLK